MSYKGDLVSRRDAIEAIEKAKMAQTPDGEIYVAKYNAEMNIQLLSSVQPEPKWIPCSERLPYAEYGESENVLATCGYRDVEDGSIRWIKTLYYNGGNWCYPTGETYLEKVYAWMLLPEPYKGGDSE